MGSTDILVFNDVQHYLCMETRCKLRSTSKTSNSPCEGLAVAPTASADSCRHAQTRGHVQGSSPLWCHAGGRAGKRSCKKKVGPEGLKPLLPALLLVFRKLQKPNPNRHLNQNGCRGYTSPSSACVFFSNVADGLCH